MPPLIFSEPANKYFEWIFDMVRRYQNTKKMLMVRKLKKHPRKNNKVWIKLGPSFGAR